ncbi:MAG: hypothetical protein M5R42_12945 [Rhodocyclaceae bacterium]|nr:hypothetical protein [Rhodocyclaceae bacterium]
MSFSLPKRHAFFIASLLILPSELLLALPSFAQVTRNAPPVPAVLGPSPVRPAASPGAIGAIHLAFGSFPGNTYEILIAGSNLNPRTVFSFDDGVEAIGAPPVGWRRSVATDRARTAKRRAWYASCG